MLDWHDLFHCDHVGLSFGMSGRCLVDIEFKEVFKSNISSKVRVFHGGGEGGPPPIKA